MDKEVVKELIQDDLTVKNLTYELNELLYNEKKQGKLKQDYVALKQLLSQGGHASENAAKSIHQFVIS